MAPPPAMTRKIAREIRHWARVQNYHLDVCQNRGYKTATGPRDAEIRAAYREMYFYMGVARDRLNKMWRKLEKWANKHNMPQRFESTLSGKTKLRVVMADDGVGLTDSQVDNYLVVDDEFTGPGVGLNKYERFFEVLDAMSDMASVWGLRMQYWIEEWDAQGNTPRERQMMTILTEEQNAVVLLNSVFSDIAVDIKEKKGDADTVDELRLRNRYPRRRGKLVGGMYAINRGVTTTAGVPGGQPLTAGNEPNEYDPDVNTVRDEPPMGTDPGA